mgnify:CR=1 FL=1|jgi:FtsP/CotA-like multicopper oxidase with cupredoxin domain
MITRRDLLAGASAGLATTLAPRMTWAASDPQPLAMPPLVDVTQSGRFSLEAQAGQTDFLGKSATNTWGFNQSYLGPTLRMPNKADMQAEVKNALDETISVHWHGMIIPGDVDGGPHQTIKPGATWSPELAIDQEQATIWYHSHIHGETARQVHNGLAGVLHLTDDLDGERGLPSTYGVDDLTLVLQDRRFDNRGRSNYAASMPDQMMGFLGNTIVVNGQVGRTAVVPKGIVRLRLLNGSNSRIYGLDLSDNRPMHLIATDVGLLDKPITLSTLSLAPGERYEVLVDFSDGRDVVLQSRQSDNANMGGGGNASSRFDVLPFTVNETSAAQIDAIPQDLGGSRPEMDANGAKQRQIALEMQMGMGMMMGRRTQQFKINGKSFDMDRLDFTAKLGQIERWSVSANTQAHPFHIHGVKFQVLSENGSAPSAQNTGWKDTVLVNSRVELLMRFDKLASADLPYMYHCHILEHEDGGMMGQFSVT